MRLSSVSKEYVRVRWVLTAEAVAEGITLSTQPVVMAFLSSDTAEPTAPDEVTATWLTAAGTARTAGVLVGPGALVKAEGNYTVWSKITDTPETVWRKIGSLTIT